MTKTDEEINPKVLTEATAKKLLEIMSRKADELNRSTSGVSGVAANVIDGCRRLLAEALRFDGSPNLDRFYGHDPLDEHIENLGSIFDEWNGFTKSRPFDRKETVHEEDSPESTWRSP